MEKRLNGNYTRILRAILNNSWRQHPTKQQLYGHLPPITKSIKIRRTRHAEHCSRNRDELIRDVLLWTSSHVQAKAERLARTYTQQFCLDTGCSPEELLEAMNDREGWRESVSDIRADGATWWWCWWWSIILYNLTLVHVRWALFREISVGCKGESARLRPRSKRLLTPVTLFRSLSGW